MQQRGFTKFQKVTLLRFTRSLSVHEQTSVLITKNNQVVNGIPFVAPAVFPHLFRQIHYPMFGFCSSRLIRLRLNIIGWAPSNPKTWNATAWLHEVTLLHFTRSLSVHEQTSVLITKNNQVVNGIPFVAPAVFPHLFRQIHYPMFGFCSSRLIRLRLNIIGWAPSNPKTWNATAWLHEVTLLHFTRSLSPAPDPEELGR